MVNSPEGSSQVRGNKFAGRVVARMLSPTGPPFEG